MLSGLIKQDGYDYNAITAVFDIHAIELNERPELFSRITKLINIIELEKKSRQQ